LAIVKRIVSEHGGEVYARNGDAGGAVIVVELPCVAS
jgi:nitrogen fixation/metabolism regulation signal transduction histidine kinase